MRSSGALFFVLLALLLSAGAAEPTRTPVQPGKLMPRVSCPGFEAQAYALYVPSGYEPSRVWPVLYCFDPRGDALRAIERFIPGAERLGYVVAASHNSRNSDPAGTGIAAEAMIRDTHRVLRLDPQRCYAAGFSGGAVVACAVATALEFRGVIAVGGPLTEESVSSNSKRGFALFGAAGDKDFNYRPMRNVDRALHGSGRVHRFATFSGPHEWLPAELATDALDWFDLHALRLGLRPPDQDEVERRFRACLQAALEEADELRSFRAYEAIVADFSGLCDVSGPRRRADALAASPSLEDLQEAEAKSDRAEARWIDRLEEAARAARLGLSSDHARLHAPRLPRWGSSTPSDNERAGGRGASAFEQFPSDMAYAGSPSGEDGWANLESVSRRASRAAREDVGVRRALNGVFAGYVERARQLMLEEDYREAADLLRVATTLYPEAGDALLLLARAYALQGRVREGRNALDRAIAVAPGNQELVAAIEHALANPVEAVVTLQPFLVEERGVLTTSFGLALTILAQPGTGLIKQVIVKGVAERSDAEYQGLRPGDEIIAADGTALSTFQARFDRRSRFHRVFMRRDTGDTVALKVMSGETGAIRSVHLRQDRGNVLLKPFESALR